MQYKIVFAGPVGAGKTTAIATISDIPVVATERQASDAVSQIKRNTTVAMDYGMIKLEDGLRVHLYGSPGQERFDFMWDILGHGALGLVLMIDYSRATMLDDLRTYLDAFAEQIQRSHGAVVIGVSHVEMQPGVDLQPLRHLLNQRGLNVPVFEVDPREIRDVRQLMMALLGFLHPVVQQKAARKAARAAHHH